MHGVAGRGAEIELTLELEGSAGNRGQRSVSSLDLSGSQSRADDTGHRAKLWEARGYCGTFKSLQLLQQKLLFSL